MHLVTTHDGPTDELVEFVGSRDLAQRLWEDYKAGRNLRLEKALRQQAQVARENAQAQHRGVDGLGQVDRRMAQSLRYELIRIYGQDALRDPAFMRKLDADNSLGLKPTYQPKSQIIHPGLPKAS